MKVEILACVILLMLDVLVVKYTYNLLFGFLIGRTNRKSAQKIHGEQSLRDRLTLQYILPKLKKNRKDFRIFHKIYMTELVTLVPQYILVTVLFFALPETVRFVLYALLALKALVFIIIRLQFDSNRIPYPAQK